MRKICVLMMALVMALGAYAFPKAIYIKKGETYMKYNFGVAGALKFLDGGKKLQITGYNETVDLENADYVTFTAPVMSSLTPKQSKERMIQIGHEALTVMNAKDDASLTKAIDTYTRYFTCCDGPEEWEEIEYKDVFSKAMTNVSKLADGKGSAPARDLSRISSNIYQLSDYYGVFSAKRYKDNYGEYIGEWEKIADADYFEFRYIHPEDMTSYALTIVPSKSYSEWIDEEGTARIPHKVEIFVKEEGKEICSVTLTINADQSKKDVNIALIFKSNSIDMDLQCHVTDSEVAESTTLKIKGKDYIKTNTHVNGNSMLDRDSWKEISDLYDTEEYYDSNLGVWVDCDSEAGSKIAGKFYNATFDFDLLGKLQVKGRLSQVPMLYDILSEDPDYDDAEYKRVIEKQALYMNNYSDATFYYDGLPTPQGYITWDIDEYKGYGGYCEYELIPLLSFPDMTSFYFEDYFSVGFSSLINDLEDILKSYCDVTGNDIDFDED